MGKTQQCSKIIRQHHDLQNWLAATVINVARRDRLKKIQARAKEPEKLFEKAKINFTGTSPVTPATRFHLKERENRTNVAKSGAHPDDNFFSWPDIIRLENKTRKWNGSKNRKRGRDTYKCRRKHDTPNIRQISLIMAAGMSRSKLWQPFIGNV